MQRRTAGTHENKNSKTKKVRIKIAGTLYKHEENKKTLTPAPTNHNMDSSGKKLFGKVLSGKLSFKGDAPRFLNALTPKK